MRSKVLVLAAMSALLTASALARPTEIRLRLEPAEGDPQGTRVVFGPYVGVVTETSARVLWVAEGGAAALAGRANAHGVERALVVQPIPDRPENLLVADLTGLEPDTEYRVALGATDDGMAASFRTAPRGGESFSFIVYGDTRSLPERHGEVARALAAEEADFVLHTGDLVSDGRVWEQWQEQFFGPAASLLRKAPLWPVRGNHERDAVLYRALFDLPGNELYYSFDWGDAHFVVLDNFAGDEDRRAMLEWFRRDLAGQDADWVFVLYHVPTFNIGGHGRYSKWGREDFLPVMYEHGVDLVLNGHSHLYERFLPIAPEGEKPIHFIVTGGGGAPNYPVGPSPILAGGIGRSETHYCLFHVDGRRLQMVVKRPDGSVIDRLELHKQDGAYQPAIMERTVLYERAVELEFLFADIRVELDRVPEPGEAVTALVDVPDLPPGATLTVGPAAEPGEWGVERRQMTARGENRLELRAPQGELKAELDGFRPPLRVDLRYEDDGEATRAENVELAAGADTVRLMFPAPEPVEVPRAPAGLTVDGDLSDWTGVPALANPYHGEPTGPFRLCWTEAGLYGAVAATDDSIEADPDAPWRADSVEIFVDKGFDRRLEIDDRTAQYAVSPAPDSGPGRAHFMVAHGGEQDRGSAVKARWARTEGGYALEFFLPASMLRPASMETWTTIGLNLVLNDDGRAVRQFYSDKGSGGWRTPITWGAARLAE